MSPSEGGATDPESNDGATDPESNDGATDPGSEDGETNTGTDEGPRLVAYETSDGNVVVCEATSPTAWIKTDTAIDVDALDAEFEDAGFP